MPIITISRGSYGNGKIVAELVAEKLGYACVSRDILLETSDMFNVPEVKLVRALNNAPSVLDRFDNGQRQYVAYIQEALLKRVQSDNVVYHGLAGQIFLMGINHVLKVRIIADMYDRVRLEMEREGISEGEARRVLVSDDEERRQWSRELYGIDTADPTLYDLVLHVRRLSVHDAVDMIVHCARLPQFKTTAESQSALDSLVIAARVRNTIFNDFPDAEVSANNGLVLVVAEGAPDAEDALRERVQLVLRDANHAVDVRVKLRTAAEVSR